MNHYKIFPTLILQATLLLMPLFSLAQVEKLEGPYDAAWVRHLCFGNDQKIFLSSAGGLYQSDQAGMEWEKVKAHFNNVYAQPVMVKGANNEIYVADREAVYYSEDNGNSWSTLAYLTGDILNGLHSKSDTLFIGTDKGLKYVVGDDSEIKEFEGLKGKEILKISSMGPVLLATTEEKVWISPDHGSSWKDQTPLQEGLQISDLLVLDDQIFIATTYHGLLHSTDLGKNWQEKNEGIIIEENVVDLYQDGSSLYLATGLKLYKAAVEELKWEVIREVTDFSDLHLSVIAKDDMILVGTRNGVFRSMDAGQSWESTPTGITDMSVIDLKMSDAKTLFVAGIGKGVYQKKENEDAFSIFQSRLDGYTGKMFMENDLLYVLNSSIQAYDVNTGELVKTLTYNWEMFSAHNMVKAADELYVATLRSGIWKYTAEEEWVSFNADLPTLNIAEMELQGDLLYAATDKGLYVRKLTEENWQLIPVGNTQEDAARKFVVNDAMMLVSIGTDTYISYDAGENWSKIKVLENTSIYAMTLQENEVFVGTGNAVFVSKDKGKTWRILYKNDDFIFFNALLAVGNELYAGTTENGIYKIGTEKFEPELAIVREDGSSMEDGIEFQNPVYKEPNYVRLNIQNLGNDTLLLSDPPVLVEGADAAAFSYAELVPNQKIAPYSEHSFAISFTPSEQKSYEGTVKVFSNDAQNPVFSIPVRGRVEVLTAVGEKRLEKGFQLHPNPVETSLRLQVPEAGSTPFFLIRDITGRSVPGIVFKPSQGYYHCNVADLPTGMYILTVMTKGETWSGRFVKE